LLMAHRSTHTGLAVLVTLMLPIGTALAQGGAAPADPAAARPVGTTGIGNAGDIRSIPPGATTAPSPPLAGQSYPAAPAAVQGFAEQDQTVSRTGLATTAEDGVSTKIVPARPCSKAARETDGTTTCVGIPGRR
jgi:hypothetical protein